MNDSQDQDAITPEVLPPKKSSSDASWYHPLAGLVMMALDFGGTMGDITGFMWYILMPIAIVANFCLTTLVITLIQKRVSGDDQQTALTKGAIAGILCAIPMPIFGTALGGYILLKSGIKSLHSK